MIQDTCPNKISNVLYVKRNILARSRNHFCDVKAKIRSVCIFELRVTVKNITILSVEKCFYGEFISLATMNCTSIFM